MINILSKEDLDRVIDCALELSRSTPWRHVTLADIATESQISLGTLTSQVRTKFGLLSTYLSRIDQETLGNADQDTVEISIKDKLFDLILCRFDALETHKEAVGLIMRDSLNDPFETLSGITILGRSLATMLEAAGVSTSGLAGFARINGLGLVYLRTFQVWLKDDSADMSPTMAELDKRLNQADTIVKWFDDRRPQPKVKHTSLTTERHQDRIKKPDHTDTIH